VLRLVFQTQPPSVKSQPSRSRLNFQPPLWMTGHCHWHDRHLTVAKRPNYLQATTSGDSDFSDLQDRSYTRKTAKLQAP